MTVVYVAVIDTFTPFDASYAIVRIVLIGFCFSACCIWNGSGNQKRSNPRNRGLPNGLHRSY
ncbi:hypothetical protein PO124_25880 [Bacillus licheniformis]|nr:hypothetical protein [Bacillus licheniformis]